MSNWIAIGISTLALLVAAFEGEFRDARLVEFAETFFHHAVELFLRGRGEWRIDDSPG